MTPLVVDENMPRSTARALRAAGYDAVDVRDIGLRGAKDEQIFAFAQEAGSAVITADRDFSSILTFRPGTHARVIFVRIPNHVPNEVVNREILRSLHELADEAISGAVIVVERGRTRMRRPPSE